MKKILLLMLFLVPICFAAEEGLPNYSGPGMTQALHVKEPVTELYNSDMILSFMPLGDSSISPGCMAEVNNFFGAQPEDLVRKYCSTVQWKIIVVFMISGLMWLFQPLVMKLIMKKEINNLWTSSATIYFIYKWVGLGLMFIAIYSLIILK